VGMERRALLVLGCAVADLLLSFYTKSRCHASRGIMRNGFDPLFSPLFSLLCFSLGP
jgi:hypothetical protein